MTYRRSLEQDQAVLTAAASNALGHELHVMWNLALAANLISATVQPEEVETLRSLPGVAQVVPAAERDTEWVMLRCRTADGHHRHRSGHRSPVCECCGF